MDAVDILTRMSALPPQWANILAWYRGDIADGRLLPSRPSSTSTTPEVKGSGFHAVAPEDVPVAGLLTTDTITAGGTAPTCTTDGVLTISADCWDIEWLRDGVRQAFWPGINVGGAFEIDASGNGHTLYLETTTITERDDGTGTDWCNEMGFTVADGTQYLDDAGVYAIGAGWRIPALVDGSGCAAWSWDFQQLTADSMGLTIDGVALNIGV